MHFMTEKNYFRNFSILNDVFKFSGRERDQKRPHGRSTPGSTDFKPQKDFFLKQANNLKESFYCEISWLKT